MSNLSNCYQCNKPVCFERSDRKTMPEEYEVCYGCDDHICNDCVDWEYLKSRNDDYPPICKKCVAAGNIPE